MKLCTKCGKPGEFYSKGDWCVSCHRQYKKDHYNANRQYYLDKAVKAKKVRVDWYNSLKAGPCTDCKMNYPPFVMHWDHLRDKDFNIAQKLHVLSKMKILAEIEKCELVCANCHAYRTHARLQ